MPKIVDKEAKRRELVEAAVSIFSAKGFQNASMAEIAVRAGKGKGTIYEYFRTKEDLFFACFDWFGKVAFVEAESALVQEHGAADKLRAMARTTVAVIAEHIDLFPLTLEVLAMATTGSARERFAAAMQEIYKGFAAVIEHILREGQASGEFRKDVDVTSVGVLLTGTIDGAMLQFWFDRSLPVASHVDNFLDVLIHGLRNGSP